MATNASSTYLVYADLQMAAEAIRLDEYLGGQITLVEALTFGNNRSSKFTSAQAEQFVSEWAVVAHQPNTSTGFSGTLFKCLVDDPARGLVRDQLVMCFRSTEFADDAARDNQATNTLEIKEHGFAFGQIADMEAWYRTLRESGKIGIDQHFSVTGYSLGGHLATAFNLLRREEGQSWRVDATYTFNGAGVGKLVTSPGELPSLGNVIAQFDRQRRNTTGTEITFGNANMDAMYGELRALYSTGARLPGQDAVGVINRYYPGTVFLAGNGSIGVYAGRNEAFTQIAQALNRVRSVINEALRVNELTNSGVEPVEVHPGLGSDGKPTVDAARLDYQMAVLIAQQRTEAYSLASGAINTATDSRNTAPDSFGNLYDVYASTYPSAVANSQLHYGSPVPVFVEDQPLWRGSYFSSVVEATWASGELKVIVNDFSRNDFGDTHSLVLIVDSLSVQRALSRLHPAVDQSTLNGVLRAASNSVGRQSSDNGGQGYADHDTLERVLQGLGDLLGVSQAAGWRTMRPSPAGGTWAETDDKTPYTGRNTFHNNLRLLSTSPAFQALAGQAVVSATHSVEAARNDVAALLSVTLGLPFSLRLNDPAPDSAASLRLYAEHRAVYESWLADRNAIAQGADPDALRYTDRYLQDGVTMLRALSYRNEVNSRGGMIDDPSAARDRVVDYQHVDPTNQRIVTVSVLDAARPSWEIEALPHQVVAFGDAGSDLLQGTDNRLGDRLYGGAGNDTLSGQGGNDHLEGNADDDTLDGGAGSDTLLGGAGVDTYRFAGDYGSDLVIDSDGSGRIEVDGQLITGSGAYKVAPGYGWLNEGSAGLLAPGGDATWEDRDWRYRIEVTDAATGAQDLILQRRTGSLNQIRIRNWSTQRNLGISFTEMGASPPPALTPYNGDQRQDTLDDVIKVMPDANTGALVNGLVNGFSGNDWLHGNDGNDFVYGGDGDDVVFGDRGRDVIYGGAGRDWIASSSEGSLEGSTPLPQRTVWSQGRGCAGSAVHGDLRCQRGDGRLDTGQLLRSRCCLRGRRR